MFIRLRSNTLLGATVAIPYEDEIMAMLAELHESWMDDEDKKELDAAMLKLGGGIQKLSDEIHVGVCNGYTVAYQMKLAKALFRST